MLSHCCEICGKSKASGSHTRCSKIKQKQGFVESQKKKKAIKKAPPSFIKYLGDT